MANQSMSLSQNGAPLAIHGYLHVNVTKEQPEVERGRLVKRRHRHGAEQNLHTLSRPTMKAADGPAHPNAVGWDGSGASSVTVSLSGPGATPASSSGATYALHSCLSGCCGFRIAVRVSSHHAVTGIRINRWLPRRRSKKLSKKKPGVPLETTGLQSGANPREKVLSRLADRSNTPIE